MTTAALGPFRERWTTLVVRLRERLAGGPLVVGSFVVLDDPRLVDLWAAAGLDFLAIDVEHGALGLETSDRLLAASVHAGIPMLVRVSGRDRQLALRLLDSGAAGVMVADVRRPEQVRDWADAIAYPPAGSRGISSSRVNDWGVHGLAAPVDPRPLLVPMVETVEAADRAGDLFAVEGVDWWHVGRTDLGGDLRRYPDHPGVDHVISVLDAQAGSTATRLGDNGAPGFDPASFTPAVRVVLTTDRQLALAGARGFTGAVPS